MSFKYTNVYFLVAFSFTSYFSMAQTQENYLKQIINFGPIPAYSIDIDIKQIDADLKILRYYYGDIFDRPENKPDVARADQEQINRPSQVDSVVKKLLKSFNAKFLQIQMNHTPPLNEKNSRVYIIGGSMEYVYFRAVLLGIPKFMHADQFRFLAISRGSISKQMTNYIYDQIKDDLHEGRDVVLMDSVNKGISLSSAYQEVSELISQYNSKSRVVAFGIQEGDYAHEIVGGYNGYFGGARTTEELEADIKLHGWAYYAFDTVDSIVEIQSIPRYAFGKFGTNVKDGFPLTGLEFSEQLIERLKQYSIKQLLENSKINSSDALELYKRLTALRFYQKAKNHIYKSAEFKTNSLAIQTGINCSELF